MSKFTVTRTFEVIVSRTVEANNYGEAETAVLGRPLGTFLKAAPGAGVEDFTCKGVSWIAKDSE